MLKPRTTFVVSISNPCSESWDEMSPVESGRFCSHCRKTVIDYSELSDEQLINALTVSSESSCGRLLGSQLNRELSNVSGKKKSWLTTAIITALVATVIPVVKTFAVIPKVQHAGIADNHKKNVQDSTGRSITGNIASASDKTPLVGANIFIKGTKYETYSDSKGNFKLFVPSANMDSIVLSVRSLGYESIEIKAKDYIEVLLESGKNTDETLIWAGSWTVVKVSRWKRFKYKLRRLF